MSGASSASAAARSRRRRVDSPGSPCPPGRPRPVPSRARRTGCGTGPRRTPATAGGCRPSRADRRGLGVGAAEPAASSTSTTPFVPSTRIRSPVLMRFVAIDVPMTAGMPNSRDSTAGCEVVPPVSVTRPAIFVKSTTQAGFVIWQTRMSPSRTWSNSSVVMTTRAVPSIVPGDPAMPSMRVSSSDCWRWNRSG